MHFHGIFKQALHRLFFEVFMCIIVSSVNNGRFISPFPIIMLKMFSILIYCYNKPWIDEWMENILDSFQNSLGIFSVAIRYLQSPQITALLVEFFPAWKANKSAFFFAYIKFWVVFSTFDANCQTHQLNTYRSK